MSPCTVALCPTPAAPPLSRTTTRPAPPSPIRPPSTGSQPIDSTRSRRGSSPVVSMSTASSAQVGQRRSRGPAGPRRGSRAAGRAPRCAAPARAAARGCGGTGSRDVLHGVAVGQRRLRRPHDRERLAQVPLVEAATARRARRSCRSARRGAPGPAWWRSRTYEMNSNASRRSSARSSPRMPASRAASMRAWVLTAGLPTDRACARASSTTAPMPPRLMSRVSLWSPAFSSTKPRKNPSGGSLAVACLARWARNTFDGRGCREHVPLQAREERRVAVHRPHVEEDAGAQDRVGHRLVQPRRELACATRPAAGATAGWWP